MIDWKTDKIDGVRLTAPVYWWNLTEAERSALSNGCGPKASGFLSKFIPDSFYGLKIRRACDIHDASWKIALTFDDFHDSDIVFRDNLIAIVESVPYSLHMRWLLWLRTYRSVTYYRAVSEVTQYRFMSDEDKQKIKKIEKKMTSKLIKLISDLPSIINLVIDIRKKL